MSRIVAVANPDRRVGKTTTALALAQAFALAGHGALVVDLDPEGDATLVTGQARSNSGLLQRILEGEEPVSKSGMLVRSFEVGLDLIPSDATMATYEPEGEACGRLAEALDVFRLQYPWVVLDLPPARERWLHCGLQVASHVVVPIQAELFAREHAEQVLGSIREIVPMPEEGGPAVLLLATMVRDQDSLSADVVRDLRALHGGVMARTIVPLDGKIPEAGSIRRSLLQHAFESRAARAYIQFAKELMNHDRAQAG